MDAEIEQCQLLQENAADAQKQRPEAKILPDLQSTMTCSITVILEIVSRCEGCQKSGKSEPRTFGCSGLWLDQNLFLTSMHTFFVTNNHQLPKVKKAFVTLYQKSKDGKEIQLEVNDDAFISQAEKYSKEKRELDQLVKQGVLVCHDQKPTQLKRSFVCDGCQDRGLRHNHLAQEKQKTNKQKIKQILGNPTHPQFQKVNMHFVLRCAFDFIILRRKHPTEYLPYMETHELKIVSVDELHKKPPQFMLCMHPISQDERLDIESRLDINQKTERLFLKRPRHQQYKPKTYEHDGVIVLKHNFQSRPMDSAGGLYQNEGKIKKLVGINIGTMWGYGIAIMFSQKTAQQLSEMYKKQKQQCKHQSVYSKSKLGQPISFIKFCDTSLKLREINHRIELLHKVCQGQNDSIAEPKQMIQEQLKNKKTRLQQEYNNEKLKTNQHISEVILNTHGRQNNPSQFKGFLFALQDKCFVLVPESNKKQLEQGKHITFKNYYLQGTINDQKMKQNLEINKLVRQKLKILENMLILIAEQIRMDKHVRQQLTAKIKIEHLATIQGQNEEQGLEQLGDEQQDEQSCPLFAENNPKKKRNVLWRTFHKQKRLLSRNMSQFFIGQKTLYKQPRKRQAGPTLEEGSKPNKKNKQR